MIWLRAAILTALLSAPAYGGEWSLPNITNLPPSFGPVVVIAGEVFDRGPQPRHCSMTNAPAKDLRNVPLDLAELVLEALHIAEREIHPSAETVTSDLVYRRPSSQLRSLADEMDRRDSAIAKLRAALAEWEAYMKANGR